ncbi:MAG: prephenate dehydrogenase/arogenate dehydrogenase family protein [Streptococcaceae bacterium]|jgi:prephenate dehydrogenase|nr:prephenate dehydrogenase/arogenate dehydrogenase family protein [Streptococcaceae bacterium]
MGIFDVFRDDKDDDKSGTATHRARGRKERQISALEFKSADATLVWLKENYATFALEEGGFVVFEDDNGENFLHLYTSRSKIVDDPTSDLTTMNFEDLKDLLKELDDVDFLLINPETDSIRLSRTAVLNAEEENTVPEAEKETPASVPTEPLFPRRSERGEVKPVDEPAPETLAEPEEVSEIEPEVVPETAETQTEPESEAENAVKDEAENEASEIAVEEQPQPAIPQGLDALDFKPVTSIPTALLRGLISFVESDDALTRLYMGEAKKGAEATFVIAFETSKEDYNAAAIDVKTADYTAFSTKVGSGAFAEKVAIPSYLIYESSESKENASARSEDEMVQYLEHHFLLHPESHDDDDELIAFTNFTQIPSQFLRAFEAFRVSRTEAIGDLFTALPAVNFAHINPFTHGVQVDRQKLVVLGRQNVLIIGLGVVGASLAAVIRAKDPKAYLVGYDTDASARTASVATGRFNLVVESLNAAAEKASVILLSLPEKKNLAILKQLAGLPLHAGVLITDTGSTKAEIVASAKKLFDGKEVTFVGGHPVIGSADEASAALFRDKTYVLSADNEQVQELLADSGARFAVIDAEAHDKAMGGLEQMPTLVLSALTKNSRALLKSYPEADALMSAENNALLADTLEFNVNEIFENAENVLEQLTELRTQLDQLAGAVLSGDGRKLRKLLG